jgi:hypothetical protein
VDLSEKQSGNASGLTLVLQKMLLEVARMVVSASKNKNRFQFLLQNIFSTNKVSPSASF